LTAKDPRILVITKTEETVCLLHDALWKTQGLTKLRDATSCVFDDPSEFGSAEIALQLWADDKQRILICAETCLSGESITQLSITNTIYVNFYFCFKDKLFSREVSCVLWYDGPSFAEIFFLHFGRSVKECYWFLRKNPYDAAVIKGIFRMFHKVRKYKIKVVTFC
jgi:hypothetical protein